MFRLPPPQKKKLKNGVLGRHVFSIFREGQLRIPDATEVVSLATSKIPPTRWVVLANRYKWTWSES